MTKKKKQRNQARYTALCEQALGEAMAAVGALSRKCSEELERSGECIESPDPFATGRRVGRLLATAEMADALAHVHARLLWLATESAGDAGAKPSKAQIAIESSGAPITVPQGVPLDSVGAMLAVLEADGSDAAMAALERLRAEATIDELAEWDEWRPRMVRR